MPGCRLFVAFVGVSAVLDTVRRSFIVYGATGLIISTIAYDGKPCEECGRKFCNVHPYESDDTWDKEVGSTDVVLRKALTRTIDELRLHSLEQEQSRYTCPSSCFLMGTDDDLVCAGNSTPVCVCSTI